MIVAVERGPACATHRAAMPQRGHETFSEAAVLSLIHRISDTLSEIAKKDAVR